MSDRHRVVCPERGLMMSYQHPIIRSPRNPQPRFLPSVIHATTHVRDGSGPPTFSRGSTEAKP